MNRKKPSIVGITQGKNQPSTRFRWAQYEGYLRQAGFNVTELESYFGAYAPERKLQRPTWVAASIAENVFRTMRANQYDLRFLQRNLTATLCTWEPLLKTPFVFDVDDAIFLGSRGGSANRIARAASLVICGNNFLANHFSKFSQVTVLPTAIDTNRFTLRKDKFSSEKQIIGWSGSSSGLKYLYSIENAIMELMTRHNELLLKVVSNQEPDFRLLPRKRVIFEKWTENREVAVLQDLTIGIMPLEDDLWSHGKCSFKMLTYMAAGLPVVVSPVGMNQEILDQGDCGYAAKNIDDWIEGISTLLADSSLAFRMGQAGRRIVESHYSLNVVAPQLAKLLKEQL